MNTKVRQVAEASFMLVMVFLIIILYVMFLPYMASSGAAISLKILFELSPYILMAGLVVTVCKFKKQPVSIGLGFKVSHIMKQLMIAGIIFAITISFILIPLLCGADKNEILSFKARNPVILIYYVIKSIFVIGFGEELIWRGYFYERINEITNSGLWAVVVSSILFGLWHYPNGQNIMQVLVTCCLGLLYGFARLKVKDCSTLATGVAHGLHDAVIVILSYILL